MKKIYTIILCILAFSQIQAHDILEELKEIPLTGTTTSDKSKFHFYSEDGKLNRGFSEVYIALTDSNGNNVADYTVSDFRPIMDMGMSKHSTPVGKVEKVEGKALYKTWFSFLMYTGQMGGAWSLSFNYTIGNGPTISSIMCTKAKPIEEKATAKPVVGKNATILHDTITRIGWFKDRDCIGAVTLPLAKSCGIGCGTGSGGMAGCWNSGLGVFIYNSSDTGKIIRDTAISSTHFLLGDAQSKELIRAFLLSLPSEASGKISVKVTGYWVADGISANKSETFVPELNPDSAIHYLTAFHLLSIEGVVIPSQTKSYPGFATKSYKLTPQDLAPTNLYAIKYNGGTSIKFTPPSNTGNPKSNLSGYKLQVFNNIGEIQNQYTTTVGDSVNTIEIAGLVVENNFSFKLTALYPSSNVEIESILSYSIETQIGWFKDRDCLYDSVSLPLKESCWIDCGTGSGGMAWCWNSGLGIFIYDPGQSGKISADSSRTDKHYLLGDAQSKELIRAFLLTLPTDANGKILVKVTGYRVANGISANSDETYVPELSPDSAIHYLNAFHLLSIEGVVIDTLGYSGFATKSYKLTHQDLAPSNIWAANYTGGATVKFTPPANEGNVNSNLTGYKARVYNNAGVLQNQFTTIRNDTVLNAIDINGFTIIKDYTYTVSALYPGSGVEVESEHSNVVETSITGIALPVDDYPANSKWIQSFTFNSANYYLSVAYPKSLKVGSQTVKAYINKQVDILQPYQVVEGGFKIVPTPFMRSMGHGSSDNTNLEWNTTDSVYEGTLNFSMEGDWRVNLKIFDAKADTLIAGVDLNENGDNSTHYWDIYLDNVTGIKDVKSTDILVYPTLSQGKITVISPEEARIKVVDLTGKILETYQSSGSKTIQLNVQSGLYFVSVESLGKTFIQKVIVNK